MALVALDCARRLGASSNLFFDVTPTGRIMSRCTKDVDTLDTLLPHYLLDATQDVSFVISLVAGDGYQSFRLPQMQHGF